MEKVATTQKGVLFCEILFVANSVKNHGPELNVGSKSNAAKWRANCSSAAEAEPPVTISMKKEQVHRTTQNNQIRDSFLWRFSLDLFKDSNTAYNVNEFRKEKYARGCSV
jgi:hypothetical protein